MIPEKRSMNNCTVIIVIIALIGILFVPIVSAGLTIKTSSEQIPGTKTASSSYQYITIDTGFHPIIPYNYSQLGYTPLIPKLYSSDIQTGSTSIRHVTIDTGLAPQTSVNFSQPINYDLLSHLHSTEILGEPDNPDYACGTCGNSFIKPYQNLY